MRPILALTFVLLSLVGCATANTDARVTSEVTATEKGGPQSFVVHWPSCDAFDVTECGDKLKVTLMFVAQNGCVTRHTPDRWNGGVPVSEGAAEAGDAFTWMIAAKPGKVLVPPIIYGVLPEDAVQFYPENGAPIPVANPVGVALEKCGAIAASVTYSKPGGLAGTFQTKVSK